MRKDVETFRCPKCNSQVFYLHNDYGEDNFWCIGCGLEGTKDYMVKVASAINKRMSRDSLKRKEK